MVVRYYVIAFFLSVLIALLGTMNVDIALTLSLLIFVYNLFFVASLNDGKLISLTIGFALLLPGLSFPIDISNDFFLISDRLRVYHIFLYPLLMKIIVRGFLRNQKSGTGLLLMIFIYIFYHIYTENVLSLFQLFIDVIYVTALPFIFYLNVDKKYAIKTIKKILPYFAIFTIFDILISYTGLVPWTISYRNGIQGVFHAHELPYSISVLVLIAYFLELKLKNKFTYMFMFLISAVVLFSTQIKSTVFALSLMFAIWFFEVFKIKTTKLHIIAGILLIIIAVPYFDSLVSRIGTVFIYMYAYINGNIIFGIAPGFLSYEMKANLSEVFAQKYSYLLAPLMSIDSKYLLESQLRLSYSDRVDAFMAHNVFIAFMVSFGMYSFIVFKMIYKRYKNVKIHNFKYLFLALIAMMFLHTKSFLLEATVIIFLNIYNNESNNISRRTRYKTH